MEKREEGEVSDSNSECDIDNVYNPYQRPERPISTLYRNVAKQVMSSEDESDSSDSEFESLPKRKRVNYSQAQMEVDKNGFAEACAQQNTGTNTGIRKKNNIWANVIQEETLTQVIGDVALKKINSDRNVESYDYTNALTVGLHDKPCLGDESETEEKESFEEIERRMNRKRRFQERLGVEGTHKGAIPKQTNSGSVRNLIEIAPDLKATDTEFGCYIAEALYEHKPELIVRVVETLGRELTLQVYDKTREVEKEGGMMIQNGMRRRTSGGVFLQLLKGFEGVEKQHINKIFAEENIQWRKRKRVNRRRHNSKPQVEKTEDDGLHLKGLFSDDAAGGTKCPGSTPVTTPQGSDDEDEQLATSCARTAPSFAIPLMEACEKAAFQLNRRIDLHPSADDMDLF